ncbi:HdeD family acid-resistance protein [Leptospira licerasiae]|uniref:HdeD family acid-resistance protein n=1 Tax=Leptospira licerasiae TaxID=447106 RepID=UPI0030194C8C
MTRITIQESKHWWLQILVGILWIATGIITVLFPGQSFLVLALAFSVILAATGASHIIFSLYNRRHTEIFIWNLVVGVLDILIGSLLFIHPEITAVTLPFVFGFLLIFRSVSLISFSIEIRRLRNSHWGYVLVLGISTLLFAIFVLFFPLIGIFTIVFWTGVGFLVSGLGNLYLGWKEFKIERSRS